MTVLHIDSSANLTSSVSRDLTASILKQLGDADVLTRDLAKDPLPQITQEWSDARQIPVTDRDDQQREALALSDTLIEELRAADTVVIGVPMYNFSIPTSLKAWIDLVARQGETFRYTENGPQGLLQNKRAIIAFASGGVPAGSDADFAVGYLKHFLGFIGITDVTVISADRLALDAEGTIAKAQSAISALPLAA